MDYERLVLDNLPVIDAIVRSVARRHQLSANDTDELRAAIRLKLVDRNYEVLRRFKNESSLRTYLSTVVNRHFLDRRIAEWGKWRPSSIARRLGPHAVLLDQLLRRDGLSMEDAVPRVLAAYEVTRVELEGIATRLPARSSRRFNADEDLAALAAPADEHDLIGDIDHARSRDTVEQSLTAALEHLETQDRVILKMKFYDEFTVARISQVLGLDQKALYRRLATILRILRRELEQRGVSAAQVASVVGHPATEIHAALGGVGETGSHGPSLS